MRNLSNSRERHVSMSLAEVAEIVGGEIIGDTALTVSGACGIQDATESDITFLANPKLLPELKNSKASAVLITTDSDYRDKAVVIVENPSKAFLKLIQYWAVGKEELSRQGIHESVVVSASARLGKHVYCGPGVIIEDNVEIGDNTSILANSFVGAKSKLGKDVLVHENVTIRHQSILGNRVILHSGVVIGADGFGYEFIEGEFVKVPQSGYVCLEDNVEVGANTCIDRARFNVTRIGRGTKIDNLVQIAHNVTIGQNCLVISQSGVSGSSELENGVILAGQVGVIGHVKIGAGSKVGAQSGIHTNIPANSIVLGSPPRPIREAKELMVYTSRLPQMFKDIKALKKKIGDSQP